MAKKVLRKDLVEDNPFKEIIESAKKAEQAIVSLEKRLSSVKNSASGIKQGGGKLSSVKDVTELNIAHKKSNDLARTKLGINKEIIKEKQLIAELNRKQNKALKDEVLLEQRQLGTLEKLAIKNRQLRTEREKLNLSTKKGSQRLQAINKQLDINNKVIDKNSDKMKKQRLNVGNYTSAIGKLKSGLMQLGLGFGVFSILKSSFSTIQDFEQGQADLASVLGINVDGMKALTEQAKMLGATTTFTATEVTGLEKNLAKLGFSQKEIEDVTEATLLLAEATGTDLARAAEVTGATIRGFGLSSKDTQQVVDVMAKAFSSSSLDMEKFATSMAKVAPIAKTMGFSIEETTALLGTLTDSGLDASTAGTSLKNMMLIAKKEGLGWNEALDKINNSQDKASASLELFGKLGAASGVILAENQEAAQALTDTLLDSDEAAKKMAETQRATLGGALKLLTSAWDGIVLSMNDASGAGATLRKGIVFLADNLEGIVSVLGMLVKGFIAFKVAMFSMGMIDRIKEFVSFRKELKKSGVAVNTASDGVKKFSRSLKAIGWAAVITGAYALANAMIEIHNGTRLANIQLEALRKGAAKGSVEGKKEADLLATSLETNLSQIKKLLLAGTINEEEAAKRSKKATNRHKLLITERIKELELNKAVATQNLKDAEKSVKSLGNSQSALESFQKSASEMLGLSPSLGIDVTPEGRIARWAESVENYKSTIEALQAQYEEFNTKGRDFGEAIDTIKQKTLDLNDSTNSLNDTTEVSIEMIQKEGKSIRELIDDYSNLINSRTESNKVMLDSLNETEASTLQRNVNEAEYNLLTADSNITDEERNKLLKEQILAKAELEKLGKSNNEQTLIDLRAQKAINDLKKDEIKTTNEVFKTLDEIGDLALKRAIERSRAKQKLIDDEIAKSKELSDVLRESANEGNAIATESLALQEKITNDKIKAKEKEAKREEIIRQAQAIYSVFTNSLDSGDSILKASSKAFSVKAFFDLLPKFFKGTKGKLGDERNADFKGQDGHIVRVDDGEMILNGEQVSSLEGSGITTTAQTVRNAVLFEQLNVGASISGSNKGVNTLALEQQIANLTEVVKNKTETSFHPIIRDGLMAGVVEQRKRGSMVERYNKLI